jgi:hypothetical protein
MLQVPISAVASQTLAISLAGQPCRIALRYNAGNLYFDLKIGTESIVTSKICRNRQRLMVGVGYRGFIGDFVFVDLQGDEQPTYTGLNTRWVLYYLSVDE